VKNHALALGLAAILLNGSACNQQKGKGPEAAQTAKAQKAAGTKTIAAGLQPTGRFMTVAKAAGLDQTWPALDRTRCSFRTTPHSAARPRVRSTSALRTGRS
jgi:hypothetical protein